jgi:hypothetical protein
MYLLFKIGNSQFASLQESVDALSSDPLESGIPS